MTNRIKQVSLRLLLGAIPLVTLFLSWPAKGAHAQANYPYGTAAIIATINGSLNPSIVASNGSYSSMQTTEQGVVFPPAAMALTQGNITAIVNSYRGWMAQVYAQPLSSAQMSNNAQFESTLHSGTNTSTTAISSMYQSSYGSPISNVAAPATIQQTVDMNDAHAIDGLSLATATDQSASALITQANSIEDQSAVTAPGVADQLTAQAMALQLQSLSAQHQLLASQLRQEAGILAQMTSDMKRAATSTQGINNLFPNLNTVTK